MKKNLLLIVVLFIISAGHLRSERARENRNGDPFDPAEMAAFLDGLMEQQIEKEHIAGAAISVVYQGRLFFSRGYGYADLENQRLVDPEQTIFRIGSVTKLFTWTAVMQLVEQGKLDMEENVNAYLDFHIPDTYPQPITLKHLITHTPGFEDQHVAMVTMKKEELIPAREWLVSHIPARIYPPGEVPAYSNYGTALAGYIVARVSGIPYSHYVQEHILTPLSMKNTCAHLTMPSDLMAQESAGYMYKDGSFQVFQPLLTHEDLYPAGIIRSTVTDMARFMIAHLQGGFYSDSAISGVRILEEPTVKRMHSPLFTPHSRILGTTYGFFDFSDNGQRVIGHSGQAEPMNAQLLLLPERDLGIFVAYNTLNAGKLTRQHFHFQRAFFDHYFPCPAVEPISPPEDFTKRAHLFAGVYKMTRNAHTTLEKFFSLAQDVTIKVKNPGDGTLLLYSPWGNWQIVEEDPHYFRQLNGPFGFFFRENDQGNMVYLFTDFTPMMAFEKLRWYETFDFNMPLLLVCLLVFFSILPVAAIRLLRNIRMRAIKNPDPKNAQVALWLIAGISLLNLLFVAGNMLWGEQIVFGIPLPYKIVLGIGVVSALLTSGALAYTFLAWKTGYWGIMFRTYYTLGTFAAVAFVWFLNFWNLLGWKY